jgi:hypothetical protein
MSANRQSSERPPGAGRSPGGRLLAGALTAAVVVGLGGGFAVGATTKGKSQGGSSSTLAPTIALPNGHVASVPAPYAIAVPQPLHGSPPASKAHKAHTASNGEAGAPSSSSTSSVSTANEPVQTQSAPPPKTEPTHTQSAPPPPPPVKKSETVHIENGAS